MVARIDRLVMVLVLALASPSMAFAQGVDPVARARGLLETGDASAAYALLAPLEGTRGADKAFDFWLGRAALESGRLERAATAFERALIVDPEFDAARMGLARTYLRMGDPDLAGRELEQLAARVREPADRAAIAEYQAEVERLRARQRFSVRLAADAGLGRDTNLSATTRDFTSAVAASFGLPGIAPTGNAIPRADEFRAYGVRGDAAWRLREDRIVFVSASARARDYQDFREFDYRLYDASAGVRGRGKDFAVEGSVFGQRFEQEGAFESPFGDRVRNDRNAAGVQLEARHALTPRLDLVAGVQWSALRYPTNRGQDANETQLSVALQRSGGAVTAAGVLYGASSDARRGINEASDVTTSHRTVGLRGSLQWDFAPAWAATVVAGVSRRTDDDAYARGPFVATGRDDTGEAYARLAWRPLERWSVAAWVSHVSTHSNIAIYSFRKTEGGIEVRLELP